MGGRQLRRRDEIVDPTTLDATTRDQLIALVTQSRRGERERGFWMTLERFRRHNDTLTHRGTQ